MASNTQHFDGYSMGCNNYCENGACTGFLKSGFFSYFNDLRHNMIDRSVPDEIKSHRYGGIDISFSSHHAAESAVLIKNLTVASNESSRSWWSDLLSGNCDGDHERLGAVMVDGYNNWETNPDLVRGLIISNNIIKDVPQGIDLGNKAISKAILDGNVFTGISEECIVDDATDTVEQNNSCSP